MHIPTLADRFAIAGQTHNPLNQSLQHESGISSVPQTPVGAVRGDTVFNVPIELIDPNPYNARQVYREERIKEMAISLAADRQIQPALATVRNGRYVLAVGHYRWKGAKAAGLPTLALVVRDDLSDRELHRLSDKENRERDDQSAYDDAISWQKALADKIYASESDLSEALGVSLSTVNKAISILKLPENILEIVRSSPGSFGLSVLYELLQYAGVAGDNAAHGMAIDVLEERISRRGIENARKSLQEAKPRKPREGARKYEIKDSSGNTIIGSLKDWGASGKVTLEVKISDPVQREVLLNELRNRFSITT